MKVKIFGDSYSDLTDVSVTSRSKNYSECRKLNLKAKKKCPGRKGADPMKQIIKKLNKEITELKKKRKMYEQMYKEQMMQLVRKKKAAQNY